MAYQSIFRDDLFAGQVVIVTGGGSGIGRCTAHELSRLGAAVALVGRKAQKLEAVAAEIAEDGGRATAHACDIREEEAVKATVAAILKAHGRIDGLVNNAGGQFQAPLEAISQKGWETVVRTNLTGGFLMARECYTQWMREHGGAIVNIVADMWNGMPGMGHSGAARAGMVNFTETAAMEWRTLRRARQCRGAGLDRLVGLRRLSRRREAHAALAPQAHAAPALRDGGRGVGGDRVPASPAAGFISGETLRVDGAAPNAKRHVALEPHSRSKPWNGFHRAITPKLLQEE